MNIHAHILAWNEEEKIFFTIKHYQQFCSSITIYDNYSTDNTALLAMDMGCRVKQFGKKGKLDDDEYLLVKNNCWKGSRADYVIMCDTDEILQYDHNKVELAKLEHVTIFKTRGWNIFSHGMPVHSYSEIDTGYMDNNYSKSVMFDPRALTDINYRYGCHVASPKGNIKYSNDILPLFHYNGIGGPEKLMQRHESYRERMSAKNKKMGLGCHYLFSDEQRLREWEEKYKNSKPFSQVGF